MKLQTTMKHHRCNHPDATTSGLKQTKLFPQVTQKKNAPLKKQKKDAWTAECAKMIANASLPISFVEHPAHRDLLKFLVCEVLDFNEETAASLNVSYYDISKQLKSETEKMKTEITANAEYLAKNGRLCLVLDHWYSKTGSKEQESSYHGIALGCRKDDGTSAYYLLRFSATACKKNVTIEKELNQTLQVKN